MSIQILHERAVRVAREYLRCEAELLEIFQELDRSKGFRTLGYGSLFDYALSLGLSEGTVYSLITVARKSVTVPALKEGIVAGELTLSNARRIAPILTPGNQQGWIEKAKALPKAALEREIAREFPREDKAEKVQHLSKDRVNLSISISEALLEKLKRAQDLESSRLGKAVSLEAALEAMAEAFLDSRDPVRKSSRNGIARMSARSGPSKLGPGQVNRRSAIPAEVSAAVWGRDQGQCTARNPDGYRCRARRWLHIHHLRAVALGGEHKVENLTLLCSAHHFGTHEDSPWHRGVA